MIRSLNCALLIVLACWPAFCRDSTSGAAQFAEQGLRAFQAKDFEKAKELLVRAVNADPSSSSYHALLGDVAWAMNDADEAIRELKRAVSLNPADYSARFTLAQHYQSLNKDLDALQVLGVQEPAGPLRMPWRFTKGYSLFRTGRLSSAKRAFLSLTNVPDLGTPANFFLGGIAYVQNRFEEAREYFAVAVRLGDVPENKAFNAYAYDYGLALFNLERYTEASEQFLRAAQRFSSDPLPWMMRGRCEQELGHYQSAIEAYEASIRVSPNFKVGYYQLARLHQKYGDPNRAKALFEEVEDLKQKEIGIQEDNALQLKTGDEPASH